MVPPALNPGSAVASEPLRSELANWTTTVEPVIWSWIDDAETGGAPDVVVTDGAVVVVARTVVVGAFDLCGVDVAGDAG